MSKKNCPVCNKGKLKKDLWTKETKCSKCNYVMSKDKQIELKEYKIT